MDALAGLRPPPASRQDAHAAANDDESQNAVVASVQRLAKESLASLQEQVVSAPARVAAVLQSFPTEWVVVHNVPELIFRRLVASGLVGLRALSREMNCELKPIGGGRLGCWCAPGRRPELEQALRRRIESMTSAMAAMCEEVEFLGHTRAVIGPGGVVTELLSPGESVVVTVHNLPRNVSTKEVRSLVSAAAPVQSVVLCAHPTSASARVVLRCKADAEVVMFELHNAGFRDRRLQVELGVNTQQPGARHLSCVALLSCARVPSRCEAVIQLPAGEDAAARELQRTAGELFARLGDGVVAEVQTQEEGNCPRASKGNGDGDGDGPFVRLRNLRPDVDEEAVLECLASPLRSTARVWVLRHANAVSQGDSQGESLDQLLANLIPQYLRLHSAPSLFGDKSGRETASVQCRLGPDLEDVVRRARHGLEKERRNEQPVRLEVRYTNTVWIHPTVQQLRSQALAELVERLRHDGVRTVVREHAAVCIAYSFSAASLGAVTRAGALVEEAIRPSPFRHANSHVLFSTLGLRCLTAMSQRGDVHVQWDRETQAVRVFADGAVEEAVKRELADLVEQLSEKQLDVPFVIDDAGLDIDVLRQFRGADLVELRDGRLLVTGSPAAVDQIRTHLLSDRLLWEAPHPEATPTCPVCLDAPDAACLTLLCGHVYCLACARSVVGSCSLPLRCCAEGCGKPLAWVNVKAAGYNDLARLVDVTVESFVVQNGYRRCPQQACNQIVCPSAVYDNRVWFCDHCAEQYCLACSHGAGTAVAHPGQSCEDVKLAAATAIRVAVENIAQEILTLRCPRCKVAFVDFTGCAALRCSKEGCGCDFCALCLLDCGTDAHPHVLKCSLNPTDGYYVQFEQFESIHRARQRQECISALRSLSVEQRSAVWQGLQPHLQRINIAVNEHDIQ